MKMMFQLELVALQAAASSSVDLAWLQNEILQQVLEETWSLLQDQKVQIEKLMLMFQWCIVALSSTQGFSTATYS